MLLKHWDFVVEKYFLRFMQKTFSKQCYSKKGGQKMKTWTFSSYSLRYQGHNIGPAAVFGDITTQYMPPTWTQKEPSGTQHNILIMSTSTMAILCTPHRTYASFETITHYAPQYTAIRIYGIQPKVCLLPIKQEKFVNVAE